MLSLKLTVLPNGWVKKTQELMAGISEDIFLWGTKTFGNTTTEPTKKRDLRLEVVKIPTDVKQKLSAVLNEMGEAIDQLYRYKDQ